MARGSTATVLYDSLRRSLRVTAQAMKEAADAADAVSQGARAVGGAEALREASSSPPPPAAESEGDDADPDSDP
jgi:hypothetical protein